MCKQKKRKQKITGNVTAKPAQKTRTKRRKPKYLSLSLKLSPQKNYKKTKMTHKKQKLQLNFFPLHPEKQAEDSSSSEYMHDQDNNNNNNNNINNNSVIDASFIFDTATDSTTTLDGLLTASEEGPLSPPTMASYGKSTDESGKCSNYGLVRTAMRCKERDASEERWVSYSEVVDSKKMEIKEEEGSSCVDNDDGDDDDEGAWRVTQGQKKKRLLLDLKLDYQEIMNAWSDKAPLFVDGESPQTVPDLLLDPNMLIDAWGNNGNLWSVPEMTGNVGRFTVDELGCKEGWNREHREASVLRYKEKRQNRLFAKRIRYEVRKLNAEKRPRMKGRFVKRNSEA